MTLSPTVHRSTELSYLTVHNTDDYLCLSFFLNRNVQIAISEKYSPE